MNALTVQAHTVAEVETMAEAIATSGLFGMKTKAHAFALMLVAQAEGRNPVTAAMEYDIIQGRPALKAQAALARFQAAGGCIRWGERTDRAVEASFAHPQGGELTIRWDIARAQAAQLTGKDNWKKFPAQMLSARVIAEGVRAVFPACLNGVYLAEEVQDFDAPPAPRMDAKKEVQQEAPKPKAKLAPREKAVELANRALAAGFTEAQISAAIGSDMDAVTIAAAKAFFAIVEAEEMNQSEYRDDMADQHDTEDDA